MHLSTLNYRQISFFLQNLFNLGISLQILCKSLLFFHSKHLCYGWLSEVSIDQNCLFLMLHKCQCQIDCRHTLSFLRKRTGNEQNLFMLLFHLFLDTKLSRLHRLLKSPVHTLVGQQKLLFLTFFTFLDCNLRYQTDASFGRDLLHITFFADRPDQLCIQCCDCQTQDHASQHTLHQLLHR